ncbi:DUF1349 domain-containing protein [Tabrizicola sp. M-4]|uniref:DUF1349 domain-containing protein n=1 Tax=Tabrizicola sp. M-4 TaxID=3055847 RepID=UPI003DA891A5
MSVFDRMAWLNPPAMAAVEGEALRVVTAEGTDFWRETFYGFTRHSGHFLWEEVPGDFTAEVVIVGRYEALYDQAGLMMRLSDRHWIKCGIEVNDGVPVFSTVVTDGKSDWATMPLPFDAARVRLRLSRHGDAVRVDVARPGGGWFLARLGHLPGDGPAQVGVMACSPERGGFEVLFSDYRRGPPIARDLHNGL